MHNMPHHDAERPPSAPKFADWLWPSCDTEESAKRAVKLAIFAATIRLIVLLGPTVVLAFGLPGLAIAGLFRGLMLPDVIITVTVLILLRHNSYTGALLGLFWTIFNRAHFYFGLLGGRGAHYEFLELLIQHVIPWLFVLFHLHGVRGISAIRTMVKPRID